MKSILSALHKTYVSVPIDMRERYFKILLVMFVISFSVNLLYLLRIYLMKKFGEEGHICTKCGEMFHPRHCIDGEPPARCSRNHDSRHFKKVYICTIRRYDFWKKEGSEEN